MAVPLQARGARASLRRIGKRARKVKVCLPCGRKEAAMKPVRRWSLAVAAAAAALLAAGAAQAHWRGNGVQFGIAPPMYAPAFPYHHGPYHHGPYHYAPPAYHPPPAATEGCYAGAWVCPLQGPAWVGSPCACPTSRGQAWGRAR
jgi:hypothetical protein